MSQQSKLVDISLRIATDVVKLQTNLQTENVNAHVVDQAVFCATLLGESVYTAMSKTDETERNCLLQEVLEDVTRLEYWLKLFVQLAYITEIESRPLLFDLREVKLLIGNILPKE